MGQHYPNGAEVGIVCSCMTCRQPPVTHRSLVDVNYEYYSVKQLGIVF